MHYLDVYFFKYDAVQRNKDLSIFLKYYLDKNLDSQLSIDKIFLVKVWALVGITVGCFVTNNSASNRMIE